MALNIFSRCLSTVRSATPLLTQSTAKFHSLTQSAITQPNAGGGWNLTSIRTKIINTFPKPRETERVKHSYKERIKTRGGRLVLMRRILRGRHIIAH